MNKKLLSVSLASLMLVSQVVPVVAVETETSANSTLEISDIADFKKPADLEVAPLEDNDVKDEEEPKLEVASLRLDLQMAVRAVEGIEAQNDKEKEMLTKYNEAVDELDSQINKYENSLNRPNGAVGGIEQIIDVQTIPVRIQLLIRIGRAIRFGTTELSNKVVAAHTKLTEYVLVGILYVLNPFSSNDQILQYIDSWNALEQELLSYPDLQPGDIATIYKKAAVSRELREARKVRNDANRTFKRFLAQGLTEEINKTVGMIFRITVTCGELDAQVEKLHQAMERVTGPKIRVEKIEFMEGQTGYIHLDETTRIRPVIFPDEVKNKDYIMYSSNSYVARVEDGIIRPLKIGSVKITVVSLDNGKKASFDLIITEPGAILQGVPKLTPTGINIVDTNGGHNPKPIDPVPHPVGTLERQVNIVKFNTKEVKLNVGETLDLSKNALALPQDAVNKTLTFKTEKNEVLDVKENGEIKALKEGEVKVVAEAESGALDVITVKVEDENRVENYEITSIGTTKKVAGVFSIFVNATKEGLPYTGPATLKISSGNRTLTRNFYLENGKGEVKFTGFDFGVWRTAYTGTVSLGNVEKDFQMLIK